MKKCAQNTAVDRIKQFRNGISDVCPMIYAMVLRCLLHIWHHSPSDWYQITHFVWWIQDTLFSDHECKLSTLNTPITMPWTKLFCSFPMLFSFNCRDQYISKFPFIRCECQPPKCDKDAMLTTAHSSSSDSKRNLYLFGCHPCRFVIFLPAISKPNACVNERRDEFSNFMNINA